MNHFSVHDVLDLTAVIPRCIVKIQDSDDEATLQENIRDRIVTRSSPV